MLNCVLYLNFYHLITLYPNYCFNLHTETQPVFVLEQQLVLADPESQSVLDVSSLLKLSSAEDQMKDDRVGKKMSELQM